MVMNNKANLIYLSWDKASKVDKPKRKINQPILNLTDLIINLEFGSNRYVLNVKCRRFQHLKAILRKFTLLRVRGGL